MGRSSSRPNMAYSAGSLICIGFSASRNRRKAIIVHCGRMGKRHERVYGEEHQKKSSKGTVRTKMKCGNVKMQRTRDFSRREPQQSQGPEQYVYTAQKISRYSCTQVATGAHYHRQYSAYTVDRAAGIHEYRQ